MIIRWNECCLHIPLFKWALVHWSIEEYAWFNWHKSNFVFENLPIAGINLIYMQWLKDLYVTEVDEMNVVQYYFLCSNVLFSLYRVMTQIWLNWLKSNFLFYCSSIADINHTSYLRFQKYFYLIVVKWNERFSHVIR